MVRRIRDLMLAGAVGGLLVLGGTALADVPDTEPSAPDPAHTLYFCVQRPNGPTSAPNRPVYAFDHSLAVAQGRPDCATTLGSNWDTVKAVPAVPSTP